MHFRLFFVVTISMISTAVTDLSAQNIYQWRGLNRTGEYPSGNLLGEWPEDGPILLLEVEDLGDSYSSIVVKDDVIYTTGKKEDVEFLSALTMDGSFKWSIPYGEAFDGTFKNARCTPTIEGDSAYVISGTGDLACIDLNDGRLVWSIDGYSRYKGKDGTWGTAESPLIIDNKMIYTPGGDSTTMVAVDIHSGETIWTSESLSDRSAYCSPILMELNGLKTIVTVTAKYILGVCSDDGSLRWKFDYSSIESPKSGGDINPVTPLIREDEIFVSSGYNHVGIMLKLAEDQQSVSVKWKTSELDNHHGGVLFYGGYIYGSNFTNVASGDWLCINWDTGELQYAANFHGKGSLIIS
ncbi:MAG: PQQ-binding-like beta-propeller repeat protein, partial [Bacteroidales bacterium]|nr:PQQ-binding-like beta-propeller repeat protein [Bacteroidales bacterium]